MSLDDAIRDATRDGRVAGLSLWFSAGKAEWQASVTQDGRGWRVEHDGDPVEALKRALGVSDLTIDSDIFG